jgi:hypothetical protein
MEIFQINIIYQYIFNFDADENNNETLREEIHSFHTQPQQHIAFMIAHVEKNFMRDKLKVGGNVGFFFSPELYIAPRISYNSSDHLQFSSGADIFLGDPTSMILRRNPLNDNLYIRCIYRY